MHKTWRYSAFNLFCGARIQSSAAFPIEGKECSIAARIAISFAM
jgi:hypothetical protein